MTPVTTPVDCSDEKIRNDIYIKLFQSELASPIKQINVSVNARVVTLIGFVNNNAEKIKVVDIAQHTSSCVTEPVNVDKFYDCAPGPPVQPDRIGNGCGAGWFRCGDICVPDRCFWNPAPQPSTTPSPAPASSATPCAPTPTPSQTQPPKTPDSNMNKPTSNASTK